MVEINVFKKIFNFFGMAEHPVGYFQGSPSAPPVSLPAPTCLPKRQCRQEQRLRQAGREAGNAAITLSGLLCSQSRKKRERSLPPCNVALNSIPCYLILPSSIPPTNLGLNDLVTSGCRFLILPHPNYDVIW